jgi:ketol-acid reductoisomerase
MKSIDTAVIGKGTASKGVDNKALIEVNAQLRNHPIEKVGATLRSAMTAMKKVV